MKQIIHIFRKDTSLCRLEILLSLASLAVMVLVYPLRWSVLPAKSFNTVSALNMNAAVLCTGLAALIVVSWVVLIGRIIHAESLVGKKQFWLTRPYEWKCLLAAKLLFLAAYLYLPLVIAQWLLLAIAGLSSLSVVPGLLFNLLLITGFLVLPMVAIAAITANLSRMVFALLIAVLLGFAAMAVFSMPGYSFRHSNLLISLAFLAVANLAAPAHSLTSLGHHSQLLFALLFAIVCGVVVILQYARRKTKICWLILLALPFVIATGGIVKAHNAVSGQALTKRDYAIVSGPAAPIELSSGIDKEHLLSVARRTDKDGLGFATVRIPLRVSNIAEGTALFVDQERVIVEAADGFRWYGELQGGPLEERIVAGGSTYDGSDRTRAFLEIPYAIYSHFNNVPVTMQITLAVSRLQVADSATVTIPIREVTVPRFGICAVEAEGYGTMQCRSALREPGITHVSASGWSDAPCPASQPEIHLSPAYAWTGQLDREPAEFGIAPMQFVRAAYSWPFGIAAVKKHLCTGTPMTFTQYKLRDRVQVNFTIHDLYFPAVNPASNVDYSDGRAH